MKPNEIVMLSVAPIGGEGFPRCAKCVPIVGNRAPYTTDWNNAPIMEPDATQPAFCVCPECGDKAQTPAAYALAILAERMTR